MYSDDRDRLFRCLDFSFPKIMKNGTKYHLLSDMHKSLMSTNFFEMQFCTKFN